MDNLGEWIDCLTTASHEITHIDYLEWVREQCAEQAVLAGGSLEDQQVVIETCLASFHTWDDCMRQKDDGTIEGGGDNTEEGDAGRNLCEESWVAYKTGLCLCQKACALPEGSDLRAQVLLQSNEELSRANEYWIDCEYYVNGNPAAQPPIPGCGPSPLGWPGLGDPPQHLPGFEPGGSGPIHQACNCNTEISVDPCLEVRTQGE